MRKVRLQDIGKPQHLKLLLHHPEAMLIPKAYPDVVWGCAPLEALLLLPPSPTLDAIPVQVQDICSQMTEVQQQ